MQDVLSLILGGGQGARLYPLTKGRSEPAVPIAGNYRLIDIPISNCLNSGLNRLYVLTQYLSVSLHRHLADTYKFDPFSRGFVEVLAAQQTNEAAAWYKGTADAIRQNIPYVQSDPAEDVLILSGDQLYRMDFAQMVQSHRSSGADITIAVVPVSRRRALNLGILRLDDDGRLVELVEKPRTEEQLRPVQTSPEWLEKHGLDPRGREYLANMGIYLFRRQVLVDLLLAHPTADDLVQEILPRCRGTSRIQAHLFDNYWEDLGTITTYFEANLALASDDPPFDFHRGHGVIFTRMRYLPSAQVSAADMDHCLISDGCVVGAGTRMTRCVLGVRTRIGRNVTLRETVLLGADRFETEGEKNAHARRAIPEFGVGDNSVIERAILDKDCRIGRDVRIINRGRVQEAEGSNYVIRDGIVVIPNAAVVPDGTII